MKKRITVIMLAVCLAFSMSVTVLADGSSSGVMTVSDAGIKFIEGFENFSSMAYQGSSGWYIGYGTSCDAGDYPDGITEDEAEGFLKKSLQSDEDALNAFIAAKGLKLTQCQFDALASFTYNLGKSWIDPSSRIYSYLVSGIDKYTNLEIVDAIGTWCHSGKTVMDGLVSRRLAEANLFLYGDYANSAHKYSYVIFNAGNGSVEHDIYFYNYGQPYGQLPCANLSGSVFSGWYTSAGKQISAGDTASGNITVSARWAAPQAVSYSDVKAGDWFYTYVSDLSKSSVICGYPDGTFRPDSQISCGEALKIILLAAGCGQQSPSGGNWAAGYLNLAVSKGFISSGEITDLDAPISRLLIAKVAAKALGLGAANIASPFSDTSDPYVLALYKAGIVVGSTDGGQRVYMPESGIKRSEISAIIWRIANPGKVTIPDSQGGKIQYGSKWLDILSGVPVNTYDSGSFYKSCGFMHYRSDTVKTSVGIDVSSYQGTIDWEKVKAAGVDFAIIRLGYRGYGTTGSLNMDSHFADNIQRASDAGLKVGVYFFSQAISEAEAREEANFVLSHLKGYKLDFPVVFDWEIIGTAPARTDGLSTDTLSACAQTFCSTVAAAGYTPVVYFTSYIGYMKYDLSKIADYGFWLAQYASKPDFYYNFQMWQYSSKGAVDGISGDVDLDIYLS